MKTETKLSVITDLEVNTEAIDLISGLLERVKSGEAIAVALVEVKRGGIVATGFANSRTGAYHGLNSGAARLANRLASQPDDE